MPPLPADFIHARACKLKCEKILTRPRAAQGPRRGAGAADSQGQRRPHFAEYRAWRQRTGKGHSQLRC